MGWFGGLRQDEIVELSGIERAQKRRGISHPLMRPREHAPDTPSGSSDEERLSEDGTDAAGRLTGRFGVARWLPIIPLGASVSMGLLGSNKAFCGILRQLWPLAHRQRLVLAGVE